MRNKNVSSAKLFLRNLRAAPACGPLTLPPNKHSYLFSLGRIAAGATSPCQREITSYRWRLSPGQGSRVTMGGGSGATEQQSGKETGVSLGTAEQAGSAQSDRVPGSTSDHSEFPSALTILCDDSCVGACVRA